MGNFQLNYSGSQINTWGGRLDALEETVGDLFDLIYPVGAIYISVNSTDPSILFGGTWEQIQGQFLLASSSTYTAGSTGGEATHTLNVSELPAHAHSVNQQYLHHLDSNDNNFANYAAAGSLSGWGLGTTTNNKGTTRLGIPAFNTNNAGSTAAHNNMPPYLSVYMQKRTA